MLCPLGSFANTDSSGLLWHKQGGDKTEQTESDADPLVYPNPSTQSLPVNLNHVYVVKTLDGKYAKFVVRKIITE